MATGKIKTPQFSYFNKFSTADKIECVGLSERYVQRHSDRFRKTSSKTRLETKKMFFGFVVNSHFMFCIITIFNDLIATFAVRISVQYKFNVLIIPRAEEFGNESFEFSLR